MSNIEYRMLNVDVKTLWPLWRTAVGHSYDHIYNKYPEPLSSAWMTAMPSAPPSAFCLLPKSQPYHNIQTLKSTSGNPQIRNELKFN